MQIKHEAQLIEGSGLRSSDFRITNQTAQLESYTLTTQTIGLKLLHHLAANPKIPNLVAIYLSNTNQIALVDTKARAILEKFALKPCDKKFSRSSFTLNCLSFSPDGTRLAIGQSDCIIYIYKLLTLQSEVLTKERVSKESSNITSNEGVEVSPGILVSKPTITGRFVCSSPITCLLWTELGLMFGTQEGKIKLILMNNTKGLEMKDNPNNSFSNNITTTTRVISIHNSPQNVLPLGIAFRWPTVSISYANGGLYIFTFSSEWLNSLNVIPPPDTSSPSSSSTNISPQDQLLTQDRRSSNQTPYAPIVVPPKVYSFDIPVYCMFLLPTSTLAYASHDGRIEFISISDYQEQTNELSSSLVNAKHHRASPPPKGNDQSFDLKETLIGMDYSSANEMFVIATMNRLAFIKYNQDLNSWQLEPATIEFSPSGRVYSMLTSVLWSSNGSQIICGSMSGSVQLFKCNLNKLSVDDRFDILYSAKNRVIIRDRQQINCSLSLKTQHDIKRVHLLNNGENVIIWTTRTLLLASIKWNVNGNQSSEEELQQQQDNNNNSTNVSSTNNAQILLSELSSASIRAKFAKFCFNYPGFVLVSNLINRELLLVQLGNNQILYSVKLEPINKNTLSVCQYPPKNLSQRRESYNSRSQLESNHADDQPLFVEQKHILEKQQLSINQHDEANEREKRKQVFVHLIEPKTLVVIDLVSKSRMLTWTHERQIIWLDLDLKGDFLLFRDVAETLYLINLQEEELNSEPNKKQIKVLCRSCHFSSWLDETSVLVAQTGERILIWYNINQLNKVESIEPTSYLSHQSTYIEPLLDLSLGYKNSAQVLLSASGGGGGDYKSNSSKSLRYPVIKRIIKNTTTGKKAVDFTLELTDGQQIKLDSVKVRVLTCLMCFNLTGAYETLSDSHSSMIQSESSSLQQTRRLIFSTQRASYSTLWSKLAWLALEGAEYLMACKSFRQAGLNNLANYLESCLSSSSSSSGIDSGDLKWKIAMLMGNWDTFEQLLELNEVLAAYRRMKKWFRAIEYSERLQQYRQRDILQQEQREWLMSERRFLEAAKLLVDREDNLIAGLELLLRENCLDEAVDLLVEVGYDMNEMKNKRKNSSLVIDDDDEAKLTKLLDGLKISLKSERNFSKLALLLDRVLNEPNEAISYYLEANHYARALELARATSRQESGSDETTTTTTTRLMIERIENMYGEHLFEQWKASSGSVENDSHSYGDLILATRSSRVINHFLLANNKRRALEVAIEMAQFVRASEILKLIKRSDDHVGSSLSTSDNDIRGEDLKDFISKNAKLIGDNLMVVDKNNEKNLQLALEVLLLGEHVEQAIELCFRLDNYQQAYEICKSNFGKDKSEEQLLAIAEQKITTNELSKAEQIYKLIGKTSEAIEMYRKAGNYDMMLKLVREFEPEQLENSLLRLANQLESEGRLELAEKYLLEANESTEWVGVVRMYRLASRWADAFRVAKKYCSSERDPLLVQLAYWWSKSLLVSQAGPREARRLLNELGLLKQVVEFCCENKNFTFAIGLCTYRADDAAAEDVDDEREFYLNLKGQIVSRYAKFLEHDEKFEEAERVLLENHQLAEVIKMYVDNEKFAQAVRVIEEFSSNKRSQPAESRSGYSNFNPLKKYPDEEDLQKLLNGTLIQWANYEADQEGRTTTRLNISSGQQRADDNNNEHDTNERLTLAQRLYLRAQQPELAVEMYKRRGLWHEAAQVAQRYAPHLLEGVEMALDEQMAREFAPIVLASGGGESVPPSSSSSSQTSSARSRSRGSSGLGSSSTRNANQKKISQSGRKMGKIPKNRSESRPMIWGEEESKMTKSEQQLLRLREERQRSAADYLQDQVDFAMRGVAAGGGGAAGTKRNGLSTPGAGSSLRRSSDKSSLASSGQVDGLRETKAVLGKFLDSLVDGDQQLESEVQLAQLDERLSELELTLVRLSASSPPSSSWSLPLVLATLNKVLSVAKGTSKQCGFGLQFVLMEQQEQRFALENIWTRMRNILAAAFELAAASTSLSSGELGGQRARPRRSDNQLEQNANGVSGSGDDHGRRRGVDVDVDEQDEEEEKEEEEEGVEGEVRQMEEGGGDEGQEQEVTLLRGLQVKLERSLLIAHYVSLQAALVNQLELKLDSSKGPTRKYNDNNYNYNSSESNINQSKGASWLSNSGTGKGKGKGVNAGVSVGAGKGEDGRESGVFSLLQSLCEPSKVGKLRSKLDELHGGSSLNNTNSLQLVHRVGGRTSSSNRPAADNESMLKLLQKVSLTLLQFSSSSSSIGEEHDDDDDDEIHGNLCILNSKVAYYNAGIWSLAVDEFDLARSLFGKLLELCTPHANQLFDPEKHQQQQQQRITSLAGSYLNQVSEQQLLGVRKWLRESLIENQLSAPPSDHELNYLSNGYTFSNSDSNSLNERQGTTRDELLVCLLCGKSLREQEVEQEAEEFEEQTVVLLGSRPADGCACYVHANEWNLLLKLCNNSTSKAPPLSLAELARRRRRRRRSSRSNQPGAANSMIRVKSERGGVAARFNPIFFNSSSTTQRQQENPFFTCFSVDQCLEFLIKFTNHTTSF